MTLQELFHQFWRRLFKSQSSTYTLSSNNLHDLFSLSSQLIRSHLVLCAISKHFSNNFDTLLLIEGKQLQRSEVGALVAGTLEGREDGSQIQVLHEMRVSVLVRDELWQVFQLPWFYLTDEQLVPRVWEVSLAERDEVRGLGESWA